MVQGIIFLPVGIGLTDFQKQEGLKLPQPSFYSGISEPREQMSVSLFGNVTTHARNHLSCLLTNKNIPAFLTVSFVSNVPRDSFVGVILYKNF